MDYVKLQKRLREKHAANFEDSRIDRIFEKVNKKARKQRKNTFDLEFNKKMDSLSKMYLYLYE